MARLTSYVYLPDPEDTSRWKRFGPDDDLPDWAAGQITNPDLLGEGEGEGATGQAAPSPQADEGPPPLSGAGSGKDNWATWARVNGVEVTDDMTREEIITACREQGVATEKAPRA